MNWINEILKNRALKNMLIAFLDVYGIVGFEQALHDYISMQQEYICKTKNSVTRIKIADIYYLQIQGHNIMVHTSDECLQKYGVLTQEIKKLSKYGFIKCNKSCAVSVSKIKSIISNQIVLNNGVRLHMSRNYAAKVIIAFHNTVQNSGK